MPSVLRAPSIPKNGLRLLWIIPVLLALENTAIVQVPHPWFVAYLYRGVPIIVGLALLFFGRFRLRSLNFGELTIARAYVGLHIALLIVFALVESYLIRFYPSSSVLYRTAVGVWLLLIPALVVSLFKSFLPFRRWYAIARALGPAWAYAGVCSFAVVVSREVLRLSWDVPASGVGSVLQNASFNQAQALLELFYPVVTSDAASHVLGTGRFQVAITGTCSGIEGLSLISGFILVWFIFARRELRLARAFLLLPIALIFMWVLNLCRLVALIAIGDAGYPDVAINGFHTEAGWIAFTLVSLGFLLVAQRIRWFSKSGREEALVDADFRQVVLPRSSEQNAAAVYLAPFLALTVAALISHAVSSNFEWFYSLRLVAVVIACWVFRAAYRRMNWRFGPVGVAVGLAVAGLWMGAHYASTGWNQLDPGSTVIAQGLAELQPWQRVTWIVLRVVAAIVTVPIAEELAFRGFVARRVMSADVDGVRFSQLNVLAVGISSVAFGLMHGRMWIVGIVAGVAFALVARARDRLGEAVAAHVTANLVLAVMAVVRGDYTLW